jgi:integrase
MPRLTESNPKYRKHKASGQAIVTIDGKDHYLGPWNTRVSRSEYDRLVSEWLANGRHSSRSKFDLTVAELVERFWDYANGYYRHPDGTPTGEASCFKKPLDILATAYGATLASEFGPLAIEVIRNTMIREGWCRNYINAQVARLKLVFKWGVSKELIPSSVHQALATVPGLRVGRTEARESDPIKPVSNDVVEATLKHLSCTVAAMVQLQRLTGARPGEICDLRIGELDRSENVWVYAPAAHKTAHHGHRRTICIGPKAQAVLAPFVMKLDRAAYVFSPAEAERERREALHAERTIPIQLGNRPGTNRRRSPKRTPGSCYSVASYRRAIARACDLAFPPPAELHLPDKSAELKQWYSDRRWHPHQLRHSAATDIRRQFGIEAAQHVLGHTTLSVTELYAERNADVAKRVAVAIG